MYVQIDHPPSDHSSHLSLINISASSLRQAWPLLSTLPRQPHIDLEVSVSPEVIGLGLSIEDEAIPSSQCKVRIVCGLGSVHSGPHDACVAVDDSTHQPLVATPSHATPPPPRPPPPSSFARCFALATTQFPSPPDQESPPTSLAVPAVVGSATRPCPC